MSYFYAEELLGIMERQQARIEACGGKLMNAERDLTKVLDIMNDHIVPVLKSALAVHAVSEMEVSGKEKLTALMDRLSDMSTAMYMAGMIKLPKGHDS